MGPFSGDVHDNGNVSDTDACVMCKTAKCGDGFLRMDTEQCDDANLTPNDGCDAACKLELGVIVKLTGLAKAIPDNTYKGPLATMACIDLPVNNANKVMDVSLQVGLDHTWVGDLVFKLVSPTNKVLTVMSRPGTVETVDDGTTDFGSGDSSNLVKGFPVTFRNAGVTDAENMGNTISSALNVCQNDTFCDFKPNHGAGPGLNFADFNGIVAKGTWKFCAGDRAGGDLGTIDAVTLTLTLM